MKWFRFTLLILAVTVISASSLMDVIALTDKHIKPNFLLILAVFFAMNCDSYDVIICCFSIGFAADITSTLIGPYFISFGVIGTILSHIRKIILMKKTSQQAFAIFVTGILIQLFAIILMKIKVSNAAVPDFFETVATSAYSAILWFLVKLPVKATGKWLGVGVHRFGLKPNE